MPDLIDCRILVLELRLRAWRQGNVRRLTALADAIEVHAQDLDSRRAGAA